MKLRHNQYALVAATHSFYSLAGQVVAIRDSSQGLSYLYGDQLGSISASTNASGAALRTQYFDAWGTRLVGSIDATRRNFTGQYLDDTGLLFYNARYYDPGIGRFVSADSIVPGNASGGMAGVAYKPLTVDFHETGFVSAVNRENQLGPWYTLSDNERRQLGSPWGPANPQALNRYAYVLNNPMKWTDPGGHYAEYEAVALQGWGYATVVGKDSNADYTDGRGGKLIRDPDTGVLYRIHNGQIDRLYQVWDCTTYGSCTRKYVYESDPAFVAYKRRADKALAAWDAVKPAFLGGILSGCAGGVKGGGGMGCAIGGALGGAAGAVGTAGYAAWVEANEYNAAYPLLSRMTNVGRPIAKHRKPRQSGGTW